MTIPACETHLDEWLVTECPYCEVKRLTRERDEAREERRQAMAFVHRHVERADTAERERDRLRDALRECDEYFAMFDGSDEAVEEVRLFRVTRAALEPEGEP